MTITVETIKQLLDDQFSDEATLLSVSVSQGSQDTIKVGDHWGAFRKSCQESVRIFVTTENSDRKPVSHSFEFKHDAWALVHSF